METNTNIINAPIFVKCTYANPYTEASKEKTAIRSYDQAIVTRCFTALKPKGVVAGQIGTCTGNHTTDKNGSEWVEANLLYCDRATIGWFRVAEINIGTTPPVTPDKAASKGSWILWLSAGLSLLSKLK